MAQNCVSCIYCRYVAPSYFCHKHAPTPFDPSWFPTIVEWPKVDADDFCGEGYNSTDGFYGPAPSSGP